MPLPARAGPPAADAEGGAPARPRKRRKCSVDDFFASSGDETGNEDEDEEPERDELKEYLALEQIKMKKRNNSDENPGRRSNGGSWRTRCTPTSP